MEKEDRGFVTVSTEVPEGAIEVRLSQRDFELINGAYTPAHLAKLRTFAEFIENARRNGLTVEYDHAHGDGSYDVGGPARTLKLAIEEALERGIKIHGEPSFDNRSDDAELSFYLYPVGENFGAN